MKELVSKGIESIRNEGVEGFLCRSAKWLVNFIEWSGIMIRRFLRKHIDWYDTWWVLRIARDGELKKSHFYKEIENGLSYSMENGLPHTVVRQNEKAYVISPSRFEGENEIKREYICPDVYVTEFPEVDLYGCSDVFATDGVMISDIYIRDLNEKRYLIQGGCLGKCRTGKYILVVYQDLGRSVDKAISMVGWASSNYYHFTYEIISRLAFADQFEKYRSWPVIVDKEVMEIPQMRDLFERINVYHHDIIYAEKCERIRVNKLLYVSKNMWMPPNFRIGAEQKTEDYLFSRSVVDNIRPFILKNDVKADEINGESDGDRKIYLSRKNCKKQRLTNGEEIELLFRESGFKIIYPEELSFEEEVKIFSKADIIVGPTGAAFTNIVYCKKGARVVVIAPASHKSYFFSNIAYLVGVDFCLLDGEIVNKGWAESVDTFRLDKDKCKRFLEECGKCI